MDFEQTLDAVAQDLEWLPSPPVFLGGAALPLFLDEQGQAEMRPTQDVDCIVPSVRTKLDFQHLTLQLLDHRWSPDPKGPICRYRSPRRLLVDLMPLDSSILGFKNLWCAEAVRSRVAYTLKTGRTIYIPSPASMLACKLDAFMIRGTAALTRIDPGVLTKTDPPLLGPGKSHSEAERIVLDSVVRLEDYLFISPHARRIGS